MSDRSLSKSSSIIDQTRPDRTPVQTFIKLLAHGQFGEIARVLLQKMRTFFRLGYRAYAIPRHLIRKHPAVDLRFKKAHLKRRLRRLYGHPHRLAPGALRVAVIVGQGTVQPKSSAFIRLISPLTDPSITDKISLQIFPENTTALPGSFDVCIIQRTVFDHEDDAKALVRNLKQNNTALVVDSDDGFHALDKTHPEHDVHQERLAALNFLLKSADQIWLSTKELAKTYKGLEQKIHVVPNSLDPRVWQQHSQRSIADRTGPLHLLYMGTATHDADLGMILPALDTVARQHPFRLSVIGVSDDLPQRPWIERLPQAKGSMYPDFVEWFMGIAGFDVGLSPLVDSLFNRCKSDIKCLDYLAAGMVPVVSDITPYQVKDLDPYIIRSQNDQQSWQKALEQLVSNPQATRKQLAPMIKNGQEYVWQKRSSQTTAKLLLELLTSLK
ncbi:MAG TPA: hypothetical protein VK674_05785 [Candidatus Limnocylindria bacterium]|nr:hypothetical protein [Candidatus Limnocylindria bacterium]